MAREWVTYNHLTHTYDTGDGTKVAAEIVDSASCLADIFHIASIREAQRKAMIDAAIAAQRKES